MSCPELVKLVKAYTYGEIPLEVYREKRRQIVNKVTEGVDINKPKSDKPKSDKPKSDKKLDPLDSFIASTPETSTTHKSLYFAIAAATLAMVLGIGIAVFLFPATETPEISKQEIAEPTSKTKAQRLIEAFLLSDQWDEQSINQFILDWQILSDPERQQVKNSQWFSNFKTIVENRLDAQKNSSQNDRLSEDLLTTLLATVDPGYFINHSFFDQAATDTVSPEILPSGTHEIPPVVELTQEIPPETPQETSQVIAKASETKLSKAKPATVKTEKQKAVAQKQPTETAKIPAKTPDSNQADIVLNQFVQSFENGNINGLMKLFAPNATTNHHTSANEISASYSELFQTTEKRDLEFSDFSWKPAGSKLEGNGKYLAHLNPKGTNIEQIFSADVTVLVDAASQPAVITGLYLTNQQFSTSLRPSVKAAIPAAQKLPPPGKEELRVLLQNFVTSYNRGDIEGLMSLFSQEARTNDRTNISEIRQDYTQLFQTTKSREIVLRDVNWQFTANRAVASGLFEAKIQPITDRQINIYRGKIRIAVTKYEGGILITQLLHNTQ